MTTGFKTHITEQLLAGVKRDNIAVKVDCTNRYGCCGAHAPGERAESDGVHVMPESNVLRVEDGAKNAVFDYGGLSSCMGVNIELSSGATIAAHGFSGTFFEGC